MPGKSGRRLIFWAGCCMPSIICSKLSGFVASAMRPTLPPRQARGRWPGYRWILNSGASRFDQALRCAVRASGRGTKRARKILLQFGNYQFWQSWQSLPLLHDQLLAGDAIPVHGTAVNRVCADVLAAMEHSPNVPLLIRQVLLHQQQQSPFLRLLRKVISFDIDAVARSASSRPKSCLIVFFLGATQLRAVPRASC